MYLSIDKGDKLVLAVAVAVALLFTVGFITRKVPE